MKKLRYQFGSIGIYIVLTIYALILVLPILWMFITAFKTQSELFQNKFGLPEIWHFENFAKAWEMANIGRYFLNTTLVVVVVFVIGIGTASMIAYVLSRFRFKLRGPIYYFVIAGMMVPPHAIIIPLYTMARELNMINNLFYLALIYCGFYLPFSVLILSSFMSQIPKELEDSAVVDGANTWKIYTRIIMPISREGLLSVTILVSLYVWNDLFLPLVLLSKTEVKTISVGMRSFFAEYQMEPTLLLAASFMSMLPVLILYTVLQEKMIKGITVGAIKG